MAVRAAYNPSHCMFLVAVALGGESHQSHGSGFLLLAQALLDCLGSKMITGDTNAARFTLILVHRNVFYSSPILAITSSGILKLAETVWTSS